MPQNPKIKIAKKIIEKNPEQAKLLASDEGFVNSIKLNKQLTPEQKKKYLEDIKFNRYKASDMVDKLQKETPSIETRLTIVSLAKKEQILDFIIESDLVKSNRFGISDWKKFSNSLSEETRKMINKIIDNNKNLLLIYA